MKKEYGSEKEKVRVKARIEVKSEENECMSERL
jgi:hypothetical protein